MADNIITITSEKPAPNGVHEHVVFSQGPAQPEKFPLLIEEWRSKRYMTQRDLARKSGLALTTINEIETGKRTPRLATLRRIASALEVEDWELHNHPRDEYAFAPQMGKAIERLDDVITSMQVSGMNGRAFAHFYAHWAAFANGGHDGDPDPFSMWSRLGDSMLVFLCDFWRELNHLLYDRADAETKAQMDFALNNGWFRSFKAAGLDFDERNKPMMVWVNEPTIEEASEDR